MKHINLDSPMLTVEDAVDGLKRLSRLCTMMMWHSDTDEIDPEDVTATMIVLCDLIDEQVELLEGIKWSPKKAVTV